MNTVLDSRAKARMRSALSKVCAIGFSSSTCLPAAKLSAAACSCRSWGSMRSTASKVPAASASCSEENAGAPVRSAIAWACSGFASTTAVTSIFGAWSRMPRQCALAMLPQPTRAIVTLSAMSSPPLISPIRGTVPRYFAVSRATAASLSSMPKPGLSVSCIAPFFGSTCSP